MLKHSHNKRGTRTGCLLNKKAHAFANRFKNDRRGTIAIIFALTAAIVFAMVGGAVDYGRWLSARSKTLNVMDTAVLAAGRVLQLHPSNTQGALAAARQFYSQNRSTLLDTDTINFSVEDGEIVVSMSTSTVKKPQGSTAGHLGTAWAWFALSPNFSSVWPSANTPASYSMLTELNDSGQPKLQKIAVLMTDGEYNEYYSGQNSATQARELCENMKAKGIVVYTVGFELSRGSTAKETLRQCATSSEHFYDADDAEALKLAFRNIALKISTLRIAQ